MIYPRGERTAFFYGTLMAPSVLYRVIYGQPRPNRPQDELPTVKPALLQSYRRHRVRHADYPAIAPHDGSTVRGSLVTGLTDNAIARLDIFEGSMYDRKKVKVHILKGVGLEQKSHEGPDGEAELGEEVEAETYVWGIEMKELEDGEWDFEEFKRDKMRFWTGEFNAGDDENTAGIEVDDGFADVDRAVADGCVAKDSTGGRGANGAITKELEQMR